MTGIIPRLNVGWVMGWRGDEGNDEMQGAEGLDGWMMRDWVVQHQVRSEERRVGKECRSRWSPYH